MKSYWYENKKKENKLVAPIRKMLDLQLFQYVFLLRPLEVSAFSYSDWPYWHLDMSLIMKMKWSVLYIYSSVRTCMSYHTVLLFAERPDFLLIYAGAGVREWHSYLCIVELRLHVQWLQNLIKKGLQTERCSFLTLNIHLAEKKCIRLEIWKQFRSSW